MKIFSNVFLVALLLPDLVSGEGNSNRNNPDTILNVREEEEGFDTFANETFANETATYEEEDFEFDTFANDTFAHEIVAEEQEPDQQQGPADAVKIPSDEEQEPDQQQVSVGAAQDPSDEEQNEPKEGMQLAKYEIIAVGLGGDLPFAKVTALEPFTGEVYFEAHQERFENLDDEGRDKLVFVEMWARVPEGNPCHEGGTLVTGLGSTTITTSIEPYDEYSTDYVQEQGLASFPQASNGRVGKAKFTISPDPFNLAEEQRIFFEGDGDDSDQMRFCIRVATKMDIAGDGKLEDIGFSDTIISLEVYTIAEFATFSDVRVDIEGLPGSNAKADVSEVVPIVSFLCDDNKEAIGNDTSYKIGQDFRLCVAPQDNFESAANRYLQEDNIFAARVGAKYNVTKFENIQCSNNGESLDLVTDGSPNSLTVVDSIPNSVGALSFLSVVTANYFEANENSFTCVGDVIVERNLNRGGRTRIRTRSRILQQNSDFSGSFESRIRLSRSSLDELELESSSVSCSLLWVQALLSFGMIFTAMMFV